MKLTFERKSKPKTIQIIPSCLYHIIFVLDYNHPFVLPLLLFFHTKNNLLVSFASSKFLCSLLFCRCMLRTVSRLSYRRTVDRLWIMMGWVLFSAYCLLSVVSFKYLFTFIFLYTCQAEDSQHFCRTANMFMSFVAFCLWKAVLFVPIKNEVACIKKHHEKKFTFKFRDACCSFGFHVFFFWSRKYANIL